MKLFVGEFQAGKAQGLTTALDFIGLSDALKTARKVFVKPNFTFPRHIPGVTTSPVFLTEILTALYETGAEVFVGESNGGYGSFKAREAFEGHGLARICSESGAVPVNLSEIESRVYHRDIAGKSTSVRLPRFLVEDVDITVSVPVLKVHAMTTVSLSVKNLWGCCPLDLRLLQHAQLSRKLRLIADLAKVGFGIIDGQHGLDEHGPMEGTSRYIGKFLAGDDVYGLDHLTAKMMGFEPRLIDHLRLISPTTLAVLRRGEFESNMNTEDIGWGFHIGRDMIDVLSLLCFHSDIVAKVVFDSPLTRPIYYVIGRQPGRRLA